MAAKSSKKSQKMGRISRRMARIERRALRLLMVPVVLIAQRRMLRSLEHIA